MIPATGIRIVRIFGITCVDDADAKLVREFKYSDVGLAKLCRKHQ
jgi:hypothetical protein